MGKFFIPLGNLILFCAVSAFVIGDRNLENFLADEFVLHSKSANIPKCFHKQMYDCISVVIKKFQDFFQTTKQTKNLQDLYKRKPLRSLTLHKKKPLEFLPSIS